MIGKDRAELSTSSTTRLSSTSLVMRVGSKDFKYPGDTWCAASSDGINDGINLSPICRTLLGQWLQTIVKVLFPAPYFSITYVSQLPQRRASFFLHLLPLCPASRIAFPTKGALIQQTLEAESLLRNILCRLH